jgi:uncharacterized membrane protein YgcG
MPTTPLTATTPLRSGIAAAARQLMLLVLASVIVVLDAQGAYAQSANCSRLASALANLEGNGDFRSFSGNSQQLRSVSSNLQRLESNYVRTGCNDLARRGQALPRQCQDLARDILSARDQVAALNRQVETGDAVARQREAILQESARFNCSANSSANVNRQARRGNLFDQLFGGITGGGGGGGGYEGGFDGGGGYRGGQFSGYGNYHTVRTVCVRKSDGYFWPISYSTLEEYAVNDASLCQEQCPGVDVELYLYDNPGQEPEQMRSLYGEPYTALPNAFQYRTKFDIANSCKTDSGYGSVNMVASDVGQSRAMVAFGEANFPLPMRDPRRPATITTAAIDTSQFVDVPLPRRRPHAPGEDPPAVPVATTASNTGPMRIVQFGDKKVRIVGPDTPYAPTGAAGT